MHHQTKIQYHNKIQYDSRGTVHIENLHNNEARDTDHFFMTIMCVTESAASKSFFTNDPMIKQQLS